MSQPADRCRPTVRLRAGWRGKLCRLALFAGVSVGCYQPQRLPPPGSLPYPSDGIGQNLLTPAAPPAAVAPLMMVPENKTFAWPADVPLKEWRYIVLHHTASTSGSVASIHAEHQQRKDGDGNPWRGIGYHFVIGNGNGMPDGAIEPTFRWQDQSSGAHAGVALYNDYGIGICLIGNFDESPPTPRQVAAVRQLVAALKGACHIDTGGVIRHGDVKATACPGKLFPFEEVAATPADVAAGLRRYPAF
ncbi:MAG: peptidoglycan recognition family protein [Planctomycetaceae bacterium]